MKDFNYNQLVSFVQVAQDLNISTAAKHLNKNRATITEHIESFEFELGHKLFNRSSRQIELTPLGNRILKPSTLLTAQIFTWQNTVKTVCPDASKVTLRMAYDAVVPKKMMKNLIRYAHSKEMDIEFIKIGSNVSVELLEKNIVDLIIAPSDDHEEKLSTNEWRILGFMPYRFYAHKDFFNSQYVMLSELVHHTQILPQAYLNKSKDQKFIFTPNNKIINDLELLECALSEKMGWAFLPTHIGAEKWHNIVEFESNLGREGFVTPILARWRAGEEALTSPILDYFEENNSFQCTLCK